MSISDTLTSFAEVHRDTLERGLEEYFEDRVDELLIRAEGPIEFHDGQRYAFIITSARISGAKATAACRIMLDGHPESRVREAIYTLYESMREDIWKQLSRAHFWRDNERYDED